jgi:phage terminase large subunit-like protein
MGKRGPKTAAAKAAERAEVIPSWAGAPPWEKKGLTRAGRVIAFIECLPITSGMHSGKLMKLRPWQREFIEAVYSTDASGKRIIRTALLTVPRKNGKSQLAAALALAHLLGPEAEERGQVFSAASDRDQAAIIFRELEAIILRVPEFAERCHMQSFKKSVTDEVTGSTYQALSSDARKAHGLSPSFFIFDELAQSLNRNLYDNLTTGTGARAEPLGLIISTQSSSPTHVMSELVDYAIKLNEGTLPPDPAFHGVVYAAPPDADPWSIETWQACNPALGDFRSLEEMQAFADQAKRLPAKEAAFRSLYLNQRVDSQQRFIGSVDWDANGSPYDLDALRGLPCFGGLDLGSTTDLTCLVLYFPTCGALVPFFWIPSDNIAERENRDKVPFRVWAKAGHVELTNGRATDRLAIARRLAEITSIYELRGIAYDRWRIEDLQKTLADEGIEIPLVAWGQGFKDMSPAVEEFETRILNGSLRHGGHPVLTWNLSNCVVETDPAGNRKLSKEKSLERIDGIIASIMAVGLAARQPEAEKFEITGDIFLEY